MPKRRANGEGNIRKRKDGRWEGRYTAGRDPETGKAIIKNVLGKTQSEVKGKLKKAIEENAGVDYGRAKNYTVGCWLEVWYENYAKIKMRPSSYLNYRGYIENHIKPQIGKLPLNDLTTLNLQQFYKKLLAEGRVERIEAQKQPKGLSAKTVRNIHQIISSALKLAVEQRLIARNPAEGCALPKLERKEMQTLPVEQLASFLREAKDSGVFALYYIDLTTGLRRGELLGLKWSDIDLKNGDLRVRRQIGRIDGKIMEMPLKTKNAYRTLPLSADAIDILKAQKAKVAGSEWVFPSPTGGPLSPDSVLHMLHRVLKRAGLPEVRFHDLRHTFATLALQNGVDIKTVSGMLGHFSAGFTLDTYAHVTTAAKREAARTMGNMLSKCDTLQFKLKTQKNNLVVLTRENKDSLLTMANNLLTSIDKNYGNSLHQVYINETIGYVVQAYLHDFFTHTRNGYFHKDNIYSFEEIKAIREQAYCACFLLGSSFLFDMNKLKELI